MREISDRIGLSLAVILVCFGFGSGIARADSLAITPPQILPVGATAVINGEYIFSPSDFTCGPCTVFLTITFQVIGPINPQSVTLLTCDGGPTILTCSRQFNIFDASPGVDFVEYSGVWTDTAGESGHASNSTTATWGSPPVASPEAGTLSSLLLGVSGILLAAKRLRPGA